MHAQISTHAHTNIHTHIKFTQSDVLKSVILFSQIRKHQPFLSVSLISGCSMLRIESRTLIQLWADENVRESHRRVLKTMKAMGLVQEPWDRLQGKLLLPRRTTEEKHEMHSTSRAHWEQTGWEGGHLTAAVLVEGHGPGRNYIWVWKKFFHCYRRRKTLSRFDLVCVRQRVTTLVKVAWNSHLQPGLSSNSPRSLCPASWVLGLQCVPPCPASCLHSYLNFWAVSRI